MWYTILVRGTQKRYRKEVRKMKMNCFDMALNCAFAKEIKFSLWTHDNKTGEEKLLSASTAEGFDSYEAKDYSLTMIAAEKKGVFHIYGYKEIN